MNNKQFISNLSATYADVRKLDVKKINLKGKNILEYIKEAIPTITHSKDTRETITENDLWGQWVETKDDGTVVVHDDYLSNPNDEEAWLSNVKAVQDNKAYSEITTDADGKFTSVVEDSVLANIQTEMIKDGEYMFYRTSLTSFSGDLSSLTNGLWMFCYTSLESFSGDLSSLVDGERMFAYNTSLTSFSGDLSNLLNGYHMFINTSLASFSGDLSSLVDGERMFAHSSLESFEGDLSSLVNGEFMFYYCESLESFSGDLSNLAIGFNMFDGCTSLTTFTSDLSSLVNGIGMFNSTSLTSFNGDLSSLVKGTSMFSDTSLTSFNGNLSSLLDGIYMFDHTPLESFKGDLSNLVIGLLMFYTTSLTSFSGDLNSLVDATLMFAYSSSLTSFSGDLSSLIDGWLMFQECTSLTSFSGDLSSLVNGYRMFEKCKLSPHSVMYIVESIKNITEEKAKYINGEIPWVTRDSTTRPYKYSAPFGYMENGLYIYTYNSPNLYYDAVSSTNVGQLTLGIDVTNDSETIDQQLQTFAEGCLCNSWAELKQEFIDKGWTVTFQYGGTNASITLSEDEQFRGIPVYARLIEVSDEDKDMAEYCTEDGTKFYNIDWGHDVTDYDSYQYFGSLLEACGYFGVIPKKYLEEA